MRRARRIAAMSDGHPYSSLIRSIAARSCSSSRMVVAVRRFFCVMPQYYHIDIHAVKCYSFFVGLGTLPRKRETVRLRVPSQWNIRWVPNKKPCSGKIFPVERNAPCLQVVRPRWARTGTLSVCPVEWQHSHDVSCVEAEAVLASGVQS